MNTRGPVNASDAGAEVGERAIGEMPEGTAEESPPAGRVTDERDYFRLADDSAGIVEQPSADDRRPLDGRTTTHKMAAKALKTAWTRIAGKRLPLLCLSSPDNNPSTKAAAAVIGFTSKWISPNKRATIIAA